MLDVCKDNRAPRFKRSHKDNQKIRNEKSVYLRYFRNTQQRLFKLEWSLFIYLIFLKQAFFFVSKVILSQLTMYIICKFHGIFKQNMTFRGHEENKSKYLFSIWCSVWTWTMINPQSTRSSSHHQHDNTANQITDHNVNRKITHTHLVAS